MRLSVIVTDIVKSVCCLVMAALQKINSIKCIASPPRHIESNSTGKAGVKVMKGLLRKKLRALSKLDYPHVYYIIEAPALLASIHLHHFSFEENNSREGTDESFLF